MLLLLLCSFQWPADGLHLNYDGTTCLCAVQKRHLTRVIVMMDDFGTSRLRQFMFSISASVCVSLVCFGALHNDCTGPDETKVRIRGEWCRLNERNILKSK